MHAVKHWWVCSFSGSEDGQKSVLVLVLRMSSVRLVGSSMGGDISLRNDTLGLVDHWFCQLWSRWPLMVAMECGRCWCSVFLVMPGKLWM